MSDDDLIAYEIAKQWLDREKARRAEVSQQIQLEIPTYYRETEKDSEEESVIVIDLV